jgi:hypothetical protein
VVLTGSENDSSNPAVIMVMVMALDIHGNLLHVVMMDRVHFIWHVYDVVFAVTCSIKQYNTHVHLCTIKPV